MFPRRVLVSLRSLQHRQFLLISLCCLLALQGASLAAAAPSRMAFTVSVLQPGTHTLHVTFRCEGLNSVLQDFKMPAWSPGFYGIEDYSRNLSNLRVEDGGGHPLPFEKIAKNTWRVVGPAASAIVLDYDVFGNIPFPASTDIEEDRAYLSPAGIFLYPAGELRNRVTVTLRLPESWRQIATGLEAARDARNTFSAADFDVLYDSPILLGNQEQLKFEVDGVPHYVALENVKGEISRPKLLADLKKMVETATSLIGDIPYEHYTFLMMGHGVGGIEHLNSASIQFDGDRLTDGDEYAHWLSYVCHEYFHAFNVKRIRPIALGPFDYEQENLTHMLWVSEGLTVYYEDLLLVRAGLLSPEQYLRRMAVQIGNFENGSGRHYQSATESSWDAWNNGSGIGADKNVAISYYDNGAMLGAMLDLGIREASHGRKSLDDVMRALYRKFFVEQKRGFTDAEFRQECEQAAGRDLSEVFDYASAAHEMDYAKYFAIAGLKLDSTVSEAAGAYLGADTRTEELSPAEIVAGGGEGFSGPPGFGPAEAARLVITDVASGSPAATAGLKAGDVILQVEGGEASAVALSQALRARKAGDKIRLRVLRAGAKQEVEVTLSGGLAKTYALSQAPQAAPEQTAILRNWLRTGQ
jgi:predicted metalloprotease with PDZ domain